MGKSIILRAHGLCNEGSPHDDNGQRILVGLVATTGGLGRAKCTCGALSEVLASAARRRVWHRQHKAVVAAAHQPVRIRTLCEGTTDMPEFLTLTDFAQRIAEEGVTGALVGGLKAQDLDPADPAAQPLRAAWNDAERLWLQLRPVAKRIDDLVEGLLPAGYTSPPVDRSIIDRIEDILEGGPRPGASSVAP